MKDALGHGSNGRGQDDEAARALAQGGPKSAPPQTHNAFGNEYGSPAALADFKRQYGGPRDHAAEQRSFNSGAREIKRVMTPDRVVATGRQFGQKIGGREARAISALLRGRHS